MSTDTIKNKPKSLHFTSKDLQTDQDVRWCPGCGDYSILKQVQTVMPQLAEKKEDLVFISGIGCSSRFPYYMDTFGMHSIHGRATAVATGLKLTRPELSVYIITGDGDLLSIGGNHFIHLLRRNLDVNILLFNNEIYGLTKGQYSPTSAKGQVTKSTPMGSVDSPFNPVALSLGADASFVARTMDRDPRHMQQMLQRTSHHKGTSLLEIYQNCNVFNDGAFFAFTDKDRKPVTALFLEHGQPLVFGHESQMGIKLDGTTPRVVDMTDGTVSKDDLWVHDERDMFKAGILARFFDDPNISGAYPRPFGVFYARERVTYETAMHEQITTAKERMGEGNLDELLHGRQVWEVR